MGKATTTAKTAMERETAPGTDDKTREVIGLAKQLIAFRTVKSRPDEIRRCIEFVKSYFSDSGLAVRELERKGSGKPSVLIGFEDTQEPQLLLLGHLDVVEADEKMFTVVERDGKLLGRGTDDMKVQDAVCMVLMKDLAMRGEKRSVMLGLTTDEEIGGVDGAQYLVETGLRPDVVFAPDAGTDMQIVTKEKGLVHLKLMFTGKSAHGSRPWVGDNALEKAIDAYQAIRKLFPATTPDNRWKATCNLGMLRGGNAPNQIPDSAEMAIDIRYTGTSSEDAIMKDMKRIAAVSSAKIEVISKGAPLDTSDDSPWVKGFQECSARVLGKPLGLQWAHGASDVRHFADAGVDGFLCAVPGAGAHGPDEYTEIAKIQPYYEVLRLFVTTHVRALKE